MTSVVFETFKLNFRVLFYVPLIRRPINFSAKVSSFFLFLLQNMNVNRTLLVENKRKSNRRLCYEHENNCAMGYFRMKERG